MDTVYVHGLYYTDLHHQGRGYVYPCNKEGVVDFYSMPVKMQESYTTVQLGMGINYGSPTIIENYFQT